MPRNRKPKRSRLNLLRRLAVVRPEYFQHQYEVRSNTQLFEKETSDASSQQPQVQAVVEAPRPARQDPRQAFDLFGIDRRNRG